MGEIMDIVVPNHVAIIMDGNGRWATARGLSRSQGHLQGAKTLINVVEKMFDKGVNVLSVFALSTENFKRSKEEINYLMNLFVIMFKTNLKRLKENNVKVIFSGRKENLPTKVIKAMEKLSDATKDNKYIFNICLNYGGQCEIVDACKKIISSNTDIEKIDTDTFKKFLYQDLPDIDLVIRTSGESRISNFMLYQMAYAEIYFTNTLWPDFSDKDIDLAIEEFNKRERRFGGIK